MNTCKECKHLCRLWYWGNYPDYPRKRKEGWCCNILTKLDEGENVVLRLYKLSGTCEMFEEKE